MLLDQLKETTRPHHQRLEGLAGLPASRAAYIAQLEMFFGYIEPWERQLRTSLAATDLLCTRAVKTGWLAEDLEFFGAGPEQRAELPRCAELPSLDSRPAWLGAAYVVEGSTLGGQVLSRHLATHLGLHDGGGRYFRSYGSEVGPRWQEFRADLVRHSSPENDPIILRAAEATFAAWGDWFETRQAANV